MRSFFAADLSLPPNRMLVGDGDVMPHKQEWVQDHTLWSLYYYQHKNVVTLNSQSILVEPHDVLLIAPGVRGSHARVGEGCWYDFFTFDLPGNGDKIHALPRHIPQMERYFTDMRRASNRISDDRLPAVSFIWAFLWNVSESKGLLRQHEPMYRAEKFIFDNMDRRFAVDEVAQAAGMTSRNLLRLFRDEHNTTITEFARSVRVKEATRLLLTTKMPIKAVAATIGYHDLQEFNKLIRGATGASPTAYRESGKEFTVR